MERQGVRRRLAAAVMAMAPLAAGCGRGENEPAAPTSSVAADRTVEISMVDLAFRPTEITVEAGTTVRFVFTNDGRIVHDATFGDEAHQQDVESGRARRDGVVVSPNKTRDYLRTFTTPGSLIIGCHQAGHYEAGMKIRLTVR